jgi:exoribonuclease R
MEKQLEEILQVSQVDNPPEIHGILQTKNYTDFMILSDTGDIIHTFSGAKLANKCLPDDHVSWKNGKCELELRYEHSPIVGTLELTSSTTYGMTKRGYPLYLFIPYNPSYPPFIVGCSEKDRSTNRIILVKFEEFKGTFPRGHLIQTLGSSGDYDAEYQALIWQTVPYVYPKHKFVPERKGDIQPIMLDGYTFNIDPKGCTDIDDVFTFQKHTDGWLVTITISDVAGYVEDGSAIDIMASLIGQTLYTAEGTIIRSMLPKEYEQVCSLLPGKESYGISLQFLWSNNQISQITWFESRFKNNKTYTYEEFQGKYPLYPLQEIASYLAGETLDDSHKWVEHMMLLYNKEAGRMLKGAQMGILRKHSAPDRQRLEEYKQHIPEFEYFAYSAAEYCLAEDSDTRHYGIESDAYTHASSPIRRYADIINQRILKLLIRDTKERYIVPISMYDMRQREKAIKRFARDVDFLKAITDGTECTGIIMEKTIVEKQMIIRIYVHRWKRMVTTQYTMLDENTVLSRDERTEIDVSLYRMVHIKCAVLLQQRNWKQRIVIHIH